MRLGVEFRSQRLGMFTVDRHLRPPFFEVPRRARILEITSRAGIYFPCSDQ